MKSPKDPVDHARTTRPHAGESMKDNQIMPAIIVIGVALVLFVGCLAAFATKHIDVGVTLAALSGRGSSPARRGWRWSTCGSAASNSVGTPIIPMCSASTQVAEQR